MRISYLHLYGWPVYMSDVILPELSLYYLPCADMYLNINDFICIHNNSWPRKYNCDIFSVCWRSPQGVTEIISESSSQSWSYIWGGNQESKEVHYYSRIDINCGEILHTLFSLMLWLPWKFREWKKILCKISWKLVVLTEKSTKFINPCWWI